MPEIINAASKSNLAKILKRVKLLLVVPASVFTAQGAYGSEFITILRSVDKLLGGINNYMNSIMLIITFARRT